MATPEYPPTLPGPSSVSLLADEQVLAGDDNTPLALRRTSLVPGAVVSLTFRFLETDYKVFRSWIVDTLARGQKWCLLPLPSPAGLDIPHVVRFKDRPRARLAGHRFWNVSATVEVRERLYVPPAPAVDYGSALKFLMHGDEADGATTFLDSSIYARTISSDASIAATDDVKLFGNKNTIWFPGSGLINTPDSDDFWFADNDFTILSWVMPASVTGVGSYKGILSQRAAYSAQGWSFIINGDAGGRLNLHMSTTGVYPDFTAESATPPVAGVMQHMAACRVGPFVTVYLDGIGGTPVNVGTSSLINFGGLLNIGVMNTGGLGWMHGHMGDLCILNGIGLYSSNFTPPTSPFPNPPIP